MLARVDFESGSTSGWTWSERLAYLPGQDQFGCIRQSNGRVDVNEGKMIGLQVGCRPSGGRVFFDAVHR
jgi:hypothetical protein